MSSEFFFAIFGGLAALTSLLVILQRKLLPPWAVARLRRRVKRRLVESDFDAALEQAMQLAKAREADHLPGWCGPVPHE